MSMNEVMNGMGNPTNAVAAAAVENFGTGATPVNVAPVSPVVQAVDTPEPESVEVKAYEIRALGAKDIFPMVKIISKIGLKDFGKCFEPEEIQSITGAFSDSNAENADDVAEIVGVSVVLKIVDVVLGHISTAEQEVFDFLASITGKTAEDIGNLPMDVFFELIVDVFKRKEFVGFMKVVSKLLK